MKKNPFHYVYCLCIVLFSNSAFSFETHCDNETQVIFNCKIRNSTKIVSVCSHIMAENHDENYLQYRYGKLGKVELTFPNERHIERGQFSYYRFYSNNSGTLFYDLSFKIGGNKYQISWHEGSKIDGEPLDEVVLSSGIYVLATNGKSKSLDCGEDVVQHLENTQGYNVEETDGIDHK